MDNQLLIKQTQSIFKQTHSFAQNLFETKKLKVIAMGNLINQCKTFYERK